MPAAGTWVSISVTYASIVLAPVAIAIDTRWWPSATKCRSPTRYTSIGGIDSPRRCASASRSQRSLTRPLVGRNRRSKSRLESTVPTIVSSLIVCRPRLRSPRNPRAATTSSSGRMTLTSSGARRSRWTSRASTWRRRMRRKSFSTSECGKPVSAGIAVAPPPARPVPTARPAQEELGQPGRQARSRAGASRSRCGPPCAAQPPKPGARPGRVRVPVQQRGGAQRPDQPVQRAEPAVRGVVVVADPRGGAWVISTSTRQAVAQAVASVPRRAAAAARRACCAVEYWFGPSL